MSNAREVILEFQLDEHTLTEDAADSIANANPAALEETYFMMPVRFCLKGVELLAEKKGKETKVYLPHPEHGLRETHILKEPSRWLELPLIGFASSALRVMNEVAAYGAGQLSIAEGGSLRFSREGDKLSVVSDLNGRAAKGDFVDVRNAFLEFARRVRDMFLNRVPTLADHRCWSEWFSTALERK